MYSHQAKHPSLSETFTGSDTQHRHSLVFGVDLNFYICKNEGEHPVNINSIKYFVKYIFLNRLMALYRTLRLDDERERLSVPHNDTRWQVER